MYALDFAIWFIRIIVSNAILEIATHFPASLIRMWSFFFSRRQIFLDYIMVLFECTRCCDLILRILVSNAILEIATVHFSSKFDSSVVVFLLSGTDSFRLPYGVADPNGEHNLKVLSVLIHPPSLV